MKLYSQTNLVLPSLFSPLFLWPSVHGFSSRIFMGALGVFWLEVQFLKTSLFGSHLHGHPEANSFEEGAAGPMTSDGFGVLLSVCALDSTMFSLFFFFYIRDDVIISWCVFVSVCSSNEVQLFWPGRALKFSQNVSFFMHFGLMKIVPLYHTGKSKFQNIFSESDEPVVEFRDQIFVFCFLRKPDQAVPPEQLIPCCLQR